MSADLTPTELALAQEASPYLLRELRACVELLWQRALANDIKAEEAQALRAATIALEAVKFGTGRLLPLLEQSE
jgi:hypothetical protein